MITSQTKNLLFALQLPGVGNGAARKLVESNNGDIQPRIESLVQSILVRKKLDEVMTRNSAINMLDDVLSACSRHSVTIISVLDDSYPQQLRQIRDYPVILYVRGTITAIHAKSVAVVGTRNASALGLRLAHQIGETVASGGCCVTSGLALGIDTAAHRGALDARGLTVAVLAHGLDTIAPASNRKLAQEIFESGGALVSEHPPGVPPRPPEFVRRNRIQSGLSFCSIVVESGESGGAIHQAKFTRDQGRDLFAVWPDGPIDKYGFKTDGAQRIIREFGACRLSHSEALREYLHDRCERLRSNNNSNHGDADQMGIE